MPLIYSIIAPLIIISSVAVYQGEAFTAIETARLLQNCMLIAGIGTLLQLYPIWKIGSGLPVVMVISFTFLAACLATASQDYGIMVGATRTRVMRDSMILSTIIYFAIFFAFSPLIGNNALWCAFLLYMLLRGVLQYFMTHRLKDIYRQADAA